MPCSHDPDRQMVLDRLMDLIHRLRPLDRQVILLYLEDQDAPSIAEITGLSAANVATKIYRIKNILTRRFHEGERSHATQRSPSRVAVSARYKCTPLTAERLRRKARRFRLERLGATFASVPIFGAFTLVLVAATIFGEIALMPDRLRYYRREFRLHRLPHGSNRLDGCRSHRRLRFSLPLAPHPATRFPRKLSLLGRSPCGVGCGACNPGLAASRAEPMVRRGNRWNPRSGSPSCAMGQQQPHCRPATERNRPARRGLITSTWPTIPHPREARAP